MEKRGKEPPNRLGSNGPQMNRSDLRNSPDLVGSHEFQVLRFSYNVRDTSTAMTFDVINLLKDVRHLPRSEAFIAVMNVAFKYLYRDY